MELSKLEWSKLITYERAGNQEIVKIPLLGNIKGTDKSIYLKVVKESFVGNYFQLEGNDVKAEAVTTSFDGKTVGIAEINSNIYDGNYKVYENGVLIKDINDLSPTTSTSISRSVPATYVYNYELHHLIELLGIGQPGWVNLVTDYYTHLDYLNPDFVYNNNGGSNGIDEIIEFEYNDWESKTAANITKMFNCFDLIPNGPNTTFEITLNADIPVNTNESTPVMIDGNPGHAFVTITKKNGTQSVTQNFGFYPNSGPKSLGLGNVSSKVVDDNNHEVNASIKMNINDITFDLIRQNAIFFATQDYNLESNNCANFAIDLFNIGRLGTDITVPVFPVTVNIPLLPSVTAILAKSPHMLFATLNAMKTSGHSEAGNIQVNRTHDLKSGNSQGECQ